MVSKKIASFSLLSFIILNLVLASYFVVADDYTLEINDEDKIVWEFTELNSTGINNLITIEGYSSSLDDYDEGDQIRWDITSVDLYEGVDEDYWSVHYEYWDGEDVGDTDDTYDTTDYRWFSKDPESVDGLDDSTYSVVIIPTDVEDYLEEMVDAMSAPESDEYSVDERELTWDHTVSGYHDKIVVEWDKNGIQEKYSLYYDDILAYEYELDEYEEAPLAGLATFDVVIIIIIIVAVFAGVMCLVVVARYSAKQKTTPPLNVQKVEDLQPSYTPSVAPQPVPAAPAAPPPVIDEVKSIGFCEFCGYERDSDAVFCPSCGQKYDG